MEKIIKVDIECEEDLYEKYNKNIISKDLINYVIESSLLFDKKDKIKVVINHDLDADIISLILEGLQKEYDKAVIKQQRNNWLQIIYLLIGIIVLFISTLIKEDIFKEIVLIGGWVFIWAMIEIQIFNDTDGKKRRNILKKLLNSEFVEDKRTF